MIFEMIVGLPANMVVLWIFCFRMKLWKSHTLFLFNLVLADFLLLISLPFRIDANLRGEHWMFGPVLCRIHLFMLTVNRAASIAFMTVVAVERYFKVVYPHHSISRITLIQARWLAGAMWAVVIALRIPMLTNNLIHKEDNITLCRSFDAYKEHTIAIKVHYVTFTLEFFLPWFLLLFCSVRIACYLRKRQMYKQKSVRKAIQAVGMISLVFTICFMPCNITGLGGVYILKFHQNDCDLYNTFTQVFYICLGFTYLNSALDPLIYYFSSSIFQDAFRSLISPVCFKKKTESEHPTTQPLAAGLQQ